MGRDRRRYPRVGVALDTSVEALGIQWQAKTVDLSPYGVKVGVPATWLNLPPGTRADLRLALPDGESPMALTAHVVRTDPDGVALNFVDLEAQRFARLKGLVDSLLQNCSGGPARFNASASPMKDRRRAARADADLDISFEAESPHYWQGKTIDLNPFGIKVAWPATAIQPLWGSGVQLRLAATDGQPPISVKGIVWRREPNSVTLLLVEVGREQLGRLKALLDSLQLRAEVAGP